VIRRQTAMLAIFFAVAVLAIGISTNAFLRSGVTYIAWRLVSGVPVRKGSARNGGVEISYATYGGGTPLVLLHGGLSSSLDWIGEIPALAKDHRVIVIDLRGHAESALGTDEFSYRLLAGDVLAVLDVLGIRRADVAGWSDGGNVGLLFALTYPQRIGRLIAISANYSPDGLTGAAMEAIRSSPEDAGSLPARLLYRLQSAVPDNWPVLQGRVTRMWKQYPQLTADDLRRISAPTLLIVGANDDVELSHSEKMREAIPEAELLVVPDVGHAVPRNAPRAVTDSIRRFLASSSR
jgi:pimeloyl-ACP methyl ester carboxylesterase